MPKDTGLADKITIYVAEHRSVSFAELMRVFPKHFKGDYSWRLNNWCNITLWWDMSKEFVTTMIELVDKGKLCMNRSDLLVYMYDGSIPKIPIVMNPPKNGYSKEHWLPVVFDTERSSCTIAPKIKRTKTQGGRLQ